MDYCVNYFLHLTFVSFICFMQALNILKIDHSVTLSGNSIVARQTKKVDPMLFMLAPRLCMNLVFVYTDRADNLWKLVVHWEGGK